MLPRPSYAALRAHYPDPYNVPAEELWRWIGYPEHVRDRAWENTCAVRMSLALAGVGILMPHGFLVVKAGKFKGRRLEIKQETLADYLTSIWGEPDRFPTAIVRASIGDRRGLIRFVQLWGPFDPQGHIDLISADEWQRLACEGGHIYWHAVECWFWECP